MMSTSKLKYRNKNALDFARETFNILLKSQLKMANVFLQKEGVNTTPYMMEKLPVYSKEVHKYIKDKAIKDLPKCQFNREVINSKNLEDFVDASGHLGYDENIFEIRYKKPDVKDLILRVMPKNSSSSIEYKEEQEPFSDELLEKTTVLIDWYTQAIDEGLNVMHYDYMINMYDSLKEESPNKSIQFVLFYPYLNEFYWFGVKSNSQT